MKKLLTVALMALGLMATGARADPIGPDCGAGNCHGSIYTLEYAVVSPTEYLIRLLIDSTNYSRDQINPGPFTDWIQGVAIKVSSGGGGILAGSSLVSTTAPGTWGFLLNNGLANGCTNGGNGFGCSQSADGLATVGTTYEWIFDIFVANSGDWLLATDAATVKANYDPHQGTITSANITLQNNPNCCNHDVPEPQPLVLVGLGLFVLAAIRRRRIA